MAALALLGGPCQTRCRVFSIGLAILLTMLAGRPAEAAEAEGDLRARLDAIRKGYRANRSAFRQGKCRYTYSIQSADSEADALASKWNDRRPRLARTHTLCFDGDTFTIQPDYDGERLRKELESGNGLITPTTVAAKGGYAIDHDALVNNVIVYSPATNDRLTVRYHPFNLASDADTSPARAIEYASARDFAGARFALKEDTRDGRAYIRMTCSADYNSHDRTCWIDPSRGHLPFVTESTDPKTGRLHSRMFLLDVHEEKGAYFPTHAVLILPRRPEGEAPYVDVREMKVEKLDLSYKPAAKDLTVQVPRTAQYSDGVNPNTAKTLYRQGRGKFAAVSVDDIKGIYDTLQAIAAQRAEEESPPAQPAEEQAAPAAPPEPRRPARR